MIYFLRNPRTSLIKIGYTKDYHARLSQLIQQHGDLELIGLMPGNRHTEAWLHQQFGHIHFQTPGEGREWFQDAQELRRFVRRHARLSIPEKVNRYGQLRLSPRTEKAIKAVAGRLQALTGRRISADTAVWEMIRVVYPDIAARFENERK